MRKRYDLTLFVDTCVVNARLVLMVKHTAMCISSLIGKHLKTVKRSAVSDHLLECNCGTDFDHFDILVSDAKKNSVIFLMKIYLSNVTSPVKQSHQIISVKAH